MRHGAWKCILAVYVCVCVCVCVRVCWSDQVRGSDVRSPHYRATASAQQLGKSRLQSQHFASLGPTSDCRELDITYESALIFDMLHCNKQLITYQLRYIQGGPKK